MEHPKYMVKSRHNVNGGNVLGKKIQSVDEALQILDFLSSSRYGFGTTTIAEELGMSPATVSRILQTLMQREFVEQTENQRYRLGMRFIHIGIEILRRIDIRAECQWPFENPHFWPRKLPM